MNITGKDYKASTLTHQPNLPPVPVDGVCEDAAGEGASRLVVLHVAHQPREVGPLSHIYEPLQPEICKQQAIGEGI